MRIAMIGARGLPATYGGVERHVEELGVRLVAQGHEVAVFCRSRYVGGARPSHRGMRLVRVPTPDRVGAEAFVHSALSTLITRREDFDVAHFHALGPGLFAPIARLKGLAVVQTIHGLDHRRAKWGLGASALLRLGLRVSTVAPHEVVVVSRELQRYYTDRYHKDTTCISNGPPQPITAASDVLSRFGLEPGGYVLFVGRLVPEKDPALLVSAFGDVRTPNHRLVVVGGSSHTDDYTDHIGALAAGDDRVILTGFQYGHDLAALYRHAALFVQPSLLEGLPITLLEAAAYETPVLASDIEPHLEVLREPRAGKLLFRAGDRSSLVAGLRDSLSNPAATAEGAKIFSQDVVERYSWTSAVKELEAVYARALERGTGRPRSKSASAPPSAVVPQQRRRRVPGSRRPPTRPGPLPPPRSGTGTQSR